MLPAIVRQSRAHNLCHIATRAESAETISGDWREFTRAVSKPKAGDSCALQNDKQRKKLQKS